MSSNAKETDFAHLLDFLQAKWQNRPCPMCGGGPWQVEDTPYQLTQFQQGGFLIGAPVVPVAVITCGNCGNTVLVNALLAKVIPSPAKQEELLPPREKTP